MEEIISQHLNSIESYRNFSLIYNPEPYFIKNETKILFFGINVFVSTKFYSGIIRNRKEESKAYVEGDGLWIYWYEDGQKSSEGSYRNGKREGLWTGWYENGQKDSEGNFRNGLKDGLWMSWHNNGQIREKGTYRNGEREGSGAYGEAGL